MVLVGSMDVDMAVVTGDARPVGSVLRIELVAGNRMALRTQGKVRPLVGLPEQPWNMSAVGLVALEASAFLGRVVHGGLMFKRVGTLKLLVALNACRAAALKG